MLTKMVLKTKAQYYASLDERLAIGEVEALKTYIKCTTKKKKSHVHTLEQKGKVITDPKEKAEIMSKQYSEVSNKPPSLEERQHLFPQIEHFSNLKQYRTHATARALQLNADNYQDLFNKQTGWLQGKSLHEPILMNFHTHKEVSCLHY